jgi:hypothetical protein
MASLSDAVEPPPRVTGMMRSAKTETPERKPIAVPMEEILEIISDSLAV